MNGQPRSRIASLLNLLGIVGALLIVAALVWTLVQYTRPPGVDQKRIGERKRALADTRAADTAFLNNNAFDAAKGLARLKIRRAMELTVAEYRTPAAARSNLVARAEKAYAAPPPAPAAPAQANPYE